MGIELEKIAGDHLPRKISVCADSGSKWPDSVSIDGTGGKLILSGYGDGGGGRLDYSHRGDGMVSYTLARVMAGEEKIYEYEYKYAGFMKAKIRVFLRGY